MNTDVLERAWRDLSSSQDTEIMRTDARVKVYMIDTNDGGRRSAIVGRVFHGILMFELGRGFDFRSMFEVSLSPGETREIGVAFLFPDDVAPLLFPGKTFVIWEGRIIARGEVLETYI